VKWLAVFLAVAFADALWTGWMRAVAAGLPALAGLASAAIILTGAFVTLAYVQDRRYLLPAVLGAFAGTYLSVALG
jgi:hypothetical protein